MSFLSSVSTIGVCERWVLWLHPNPYTNHRTNTQIYEHVKERDRICLLQLLASASLTHRHLEGTGGKLEGQSRLQTLFSSLNATSDNPCPYQWPKPLTWRGYIDILESRRRMSWHEGGMWAPVGHPFQSVKEKVNYYLVHQERKRL